MIPDARVDDLKAGDFISCARFGGDRSLYFVAHDRGLRIVTVATDAAGEPNRIGNVLTIDHAMIATFEAAVLAACEHTRRWR